MRSSLGNPESILSCNQIQTVFGDFGNWAIPRDIRSACPNPPCVNSEIKKLIDDGDKETKAIINDLSTDWDWYKNCENKVNVALQNAKYNYYRIKIAIQRN